MIEKIVLDYLNTSELVSVITGEELEEVPCYAERPEKEPDGRYIVIEKTGSENENHLQDATVAVSSYAKTLYEASELNEAVKHVMLHINTLPNVSAVRLNSDYNFTSTAAKAYRYQAVFVITYYEEGQYV